MKVTYQKEVGHCEVSSYIKIVTIDTVSPAKNSDFLDMISFKEIGWNVVSQRGLHKPGEQVMYIPPESMLPFELSEELDITKFLSKGRVRVAKLRGNRSEGFITSIDRMEPFLPYIMQWEDPPSRRMRGERLPKRHTSPDFERFYDMPNLLNELDIFEPGEIVSVSEKVHGVNTRTGVLRHPKTEEHQLYVGSHNTVLRETKRNLFWETIRKKMADKLPKDILFFGEIFGSGVQKRFHYDRKHPDILLFAAMEKGGFYINRPRFVEICEKYSLPYIPAEVMKFESLEQMRELANRPSELTKSHVREGIVIVSLQDPKKMAKCKNFEYLKGQG